MNDVLGKNQLKEEIAQIYYYSDRFNILAWQCFDGLHNISSSSVY